MKTCIRPLSVLVMAAFFPAAFREAHGQSTDPLVGPADPSVIGRQMEPKLAPRSEGAPVETPRRRQAVPEGAADIRFRLGGLDLEGATAIPPHELAALWQDKLDTEVSLAEIYAIAKAITARYGRDGYVLSQAVVPQQAIGPDGRVRITIVEGFVERVLIEGESTPLMRAIAGRVAAQRPLNNATLERSLLLLRDLPGLKTRAVLRPSPTTANAADLVIVAERKPVDAYAMVDNRGSRYLGPWEAFLGANINSAFGDDTRTSARVLTTLDGEELLYGDVAHTLPLGENGSTLTVSASRTAAEPGFLLKDEGITSNGSSLAMAVSTPVIRSRSENLTLQARLEAREVETEQRGADLVRDRTRSVQFGGSYDFTDTVLSPALTQLTAHLTQGIDALGARSAGAADLSRARGRPDFTKVAAEISRMQRLGDGLNLTGAVKGQWAFTPLLSGEEFFIGGASYGRAYDAAEISGDHGLAGRLELAYGQPTGWEVVRDYQIYGFTDGGATWDRDPNPGVESRRTAFSTGFGLRSNVTADATVSVEIAKPLNRIVATQGDDGPRAFLVGVVRY